MLLLPTGGKQAVSLKLCSCRSAEPPGTWHARRRPWDYQLWPRALTRRNAEHQHPGSCRTQFSVAPASAQPAVLRLRTSEGGPDSGERRAGAFVPPLEPPSQLDDPKLQHGLPASPFRKRLEGATAPEANPSRRGSQPPRTPRGAPPAADSPSGCRRTAPLQTG